LPVAALFFSVLISHSYQIHVAITDYLKNDIEPKIKFITYPTGIDTKGAAPQQHSEYEEMFKRKNLTSVRSYLYVYTPYHVSGWLLLYSIYEYWNKDNTIFALVFISSVACSLIWCLSPHSTKWK